MKNELISIILPVFNCEKYISRCIHSILNQSYTNWELLVVDDCSSDHSLQICRSFISSQIHVFPLKMNGGVSHARRQAFRHAIGKFIVFVDADDELTPHALQSLIVEFQKNDALSIVIGNFQRIYQNKKTQSHYNEELINAQQMKEHLVSFEIGMSLWAKMYRRSIISDSTLNIPRSIKNNEDLLCNLSFAQQSRNIKVISDIVYRYYQICNSATDIFHYSFESEIDMERNLSRILCSKEDEVLRKQILGYFYGRFVLGTLDRFEIARWEKEIKKSEKYMINKKFEKSIRICIQVFNSPFLRSFCLHYLLLYMIRLYRIVRNQQNEYRNRETYQRIA